MTPTHGTTQDVTQDPVQDPVHGTTAALTRRRLLGYAGLGAAALGTGVLSGCGGSLAPVDTAAASFGEGASGEVNVWCRAVTQSAITYLADAFAKSQDRVWIRVTPVPDAQFVTKLATAIRAGRVPDLVDFDDINSMLFIYRDAFADLTDLIAELPGRDRLSPGHLALATKDDRVYGLPFLADNSVLFCNTELFERAGLDVEEHTTGFDGLLEAARAITRLGDGVTGWTLPGNSAGALGFTVQPHVWATKRDLIAGEVGAQRGDVVDNAPLRQTLTFLQTLWREKLVPPGCPSDDASAWATDYAAGKVGMFPASYGVVVPNVGKEIAARSKIVLLPGPERGRSFFDGGDNLCLVNGAPNPSAAWEFARFAVDASQQTRLPEGGYTPIRSDAATAAFRKSYPLAVPTLERLDVGYAPTTLAYNLIYNQSDGPWLAMVRRAVFGGEVEAAMAEAQVGYDRLLQQAQA